MDVLIPFDATAPKTRLGPVLSPSERATFARVMLDDVLAAVRTAGGNPEVLATEAIDSPARVTVDERSLDTVVNHHLDTAHGPVAVVMADLALATPDALSALFDTDGDVVLAPGRGGGTNAIVVRHEDFRVDYHAASIRDHRSIAAEIGARVADVDSYRLGTDVDDPADLAEVLLHGQGAAAGWLREQGFELAVSGGRVGVER